MKIMADYRVNQMPQQLPARFSIFAGKSGNSDRRPQFALGLSWIAAFSRFLSGSALQALL